MNCTVCKNPLKWRLVDFGKRGAKGSRLYEKVTYCPYCEWKGTTGPGADLRASIKEINRADIHAAGVHQD